MKMSSSSGYLVATALILFLSVGFKTHAQNAQVKVQAPATEVKVDTSTAKEIQKKENEIKLLKSDQFAEDQAQAINRIPGANVKADDLKETKVKKKGLNLNPFSWLFRPITRLQEQSIRLEQQIMKLTGPIAALQPGMLRLEKRIVSVEGQTGEVQNQMALMQKDISAMRSELGEIKKPIMELKEPIVALNEPIKRIEKPITSVHKDLAELKTLLGLVLTSIYLAAIAIAIGTPLAAIIIWRNKHKLLKPAKADEDDEEEAARGRPSQISKYRKSA